MAGVTTSTVLNTDSALKAREIDFVTQFEKNWDALRTILGIFKPIRKISTHTSRVGCDALSIL